MKQLGDTGIREHWQANTLGGAKATKHDSVPDLRCLKHRGDRNIGFMKPLNVSINIFK